jgi:hypothetical protein
MVNIYSNIIIDDKISLFLINIVSLDNQDKIFVYEQIKTTKSNSN